jgi:hypothetical protein
VENKIGALEMMGIIDPLRPRSSLAKAVGNVCKLSHTTSVYSDLQVPHDEDESVPLKCIFLMEKPLMRRMMRSLVKFGGKDKDNPERFFARFGL